MTNRLLTPFRLLLVLVAVGLCATVLRPNLLATMGLAFHRQWFLDSYAVLAANDAARTGLDITEANPLDPLNRPHRYSDWWLGLRHLGLTREDNFLFGGLCGLAFLGVTLATVRPRTYAESAVLAVVLLSPPWLFGLQRANNDLVIFAVLGAGLLALRRTATPLRLAALGVAIVLATGLKYFPIVAAAALLVALPWWKAVRWTFGLTLVTSLFVLWTERNSISRGVFEMPATIFEFGAPVLWRDLALGAKAMLALAVTLLAAGAALFVARRWTTGLADEARGPAGERLMFAVGALILLGCFAAGVSHIYRWVFSLWLWPWLWREVAAHRGVARGALMLWLASIWADGLLCLVVNSTGAAYRPALGWRVVTQSATWVLMALLAGWLLEGFIAQARAWRAGDRPVSA